MYGITIILFKKTKKLLLICAMCFFVSRDEFQIVKHSKDEIAPVAYLTFQKLHLEDKPEMVSQNSQNINFYFCLFQRNRLFVNAIEGIKFFQKLNSQQFFFIHTG